MTRSPWWRRFLPGSAQNGAQEGISLPPDEPDPVEPATDETVEPLTQSDPDLAAERLPEAASRPAPAAWKTRALDEFADWLSELEDEPLDRNGDDGQGEGDTLSLLTEFLALRQEVRMQNREQRRAVETVTALSEIFREKTAALESATALMADRSREEEMAETLVRRLRREIGDGARRETEKRVLTPFLDVRDALIRGLEATSPADVPRFARLFRRSAGATETAVENLRQGYEMALRKYDRALSAAGVSPIDAVGKPFDPRLMRAVETVNKKDARTGIALEVRLGGFIRGDEVLRPAEVAVTADHPESEDSPNDNIK